MKLFYYKENTNFGDQLNLWLWPKLLPSILDDDDSTLFFGIGTVLRQRRFPPSTRRFVVFGSGTGYAAPPVIDGAWTVYCVRGPLTAKRLGLPPEKAITDPAILVPRFASFTGEKRYEHSFMPHWLTAAAGRRLWARACDEIGVGFIDPLWPVEQAISAIGETGVLLTEAMHGAIVADALRIPWIPVITTRKILEFKWRDWCGSLGLEFRPRFAIPREKLSGQSGAEPALFDSWSDDGFRGRLKRTLATGIVKRQLLSIARTETPSLSDPDKIEHRRGELLGQVEHLIGDVESGAFR